MNTKDYTIKQNYLLFWNSCYSQWVQSSFKDPWNLEFFNAEQFMMYHKAKTFKDWESAKKIINSFNPRVIKQYGREVQNYDDVVWSKVREEIVILGNFYKFSQNSVIKDILLSSGNLELVEASPEDPVWGIGLSENDPRCLDKSQWKGQNLLGKCIMRVRELLRNPDPVYIKSLEDKFINN